MDTSGTYIKMCSCPEIQGQRGSDPRTCDFIHDIHNAIPWIKDVGWQESSVWLPRQDQIQEMIYPHQDGIAYLVAELFNWLKKPRAFQLRSMEQLWLAFYMREKHDKIWDGDKWVKKED